MWCVNKLLSVMKILAYMTQTNRFEYHFHIDCLHNSKYQNVLEKGLSISCNDKTVIGKLNPLGVKSKGLSPRMSQTVDSNNELDVTPTSYSHRQRYMGSHA